MQSITVDWKTSSSIYHRFEQATVATNHELVHVLRDVSLQCALLHHQAGHHGSRLARQLQALNDVLCVVSA